MKKVLYSIAAILFLVTSLQAQLIKTQMHVTIRNDLGNTEEGVIVQLYETEDDYKEEKNIAAEGVTDAKGIAKFKKLKPISYFILAKKDDKNNFGGGEQTGKLEENRINKVTIVIE